MSERWKPEYGELYYFMTSVGVVSYRVWRGDSLDGVYYEIGNCFKTIAETEAFSEKVKELLSSLHDNDENLQENIQDMVTNTCQAMDKGKENVAKATCIFGNLPKLTVEVFDLPDCPTWAKYAVVNKDGSVFVFSSKPFSRSSGWAVTFNATEIQTDFMDIGKYDASDWTNSLIERPAKLPDWCKVGEWCYCKDDDGNDKYFKITQIKDNFIYGDDWDIDYHHIKQALLRPYNAEEMKSLVGKVLKTSDGDLQLITAYYNDSERVLVGGLVDRSADEIKERYIHLDGSPCGKLVHKEGDDWIE